MSNREMWIGIAVLLVAVAIAISNSISITQFSISDSNPATYAIVVMLMILLFIVFSAKERPTVEYKPTNILYGFLIVGAFFMITALMRSWLSFLFTSYRVDALLFPLILLSIITAMFGKEGIIKLKWLIVYSAFASQILAAPFLALNKAFVNLNASFVYWLLRIAGTHVSISGLVISAPSATSITIASTCADIGAFIGLVMFLLPLSYMFNGRRWRKLVWVSSGVALLLLLNFVRMLTISLEWIYYGISSAVSTFHLFAGQIMFDAVIIVMIVLFYKYGLRFPSVSGKSARRRTVRAGHAASKYYPLAAAIAIGVIVFAITYPYHSVADISSGTFYNSEVNSTNATMSLTYLSSIRSENSSIYSLGTVSNGIVGFSIANSFNNHTKYVVMTANGYPDPSGMITNTSGTRSAGSHILNNGVVLRSYTTLSGGQEFYVNTFSLPVIVNGRYVSVKEEMISSPGPGLEACSISSGYIDSVESGIANLLLGHGARGIVFCDAYESAAAVNGSVYG